MMRYPNSQIIYHKNISHANRGMHLEELINEANKFYLDNDIALVYKKATPIGVVNVTSEKNTKVITKAYFKEPSTLDYNGIYKGMYIEFDAKECSSKTSFPLSNISCNQISHIRKVIFHKGVVFIIIKITNNYFLLPGNNLINFIKNNKRKSIPVDVLKKISLKICKNKNIVVDYITTLNEYLEVSKWKLAN